MAESVTAYYNEHDPFAAAWLRELIAQKLIAPGHVDERSIEDVLPADLRGFAQCHFFAGIGVWSYALRLAGVPDDTPVWTGSCPCQPFSAAGKRAGAADERHLWPAFFHLIGVGEPPIVFGEQVASPDGLAWFDFVRTDLEDAGYAVGAADLCAAGIGAPHIRQRLYWVADASGERLEGRDGRALGHERAATERSGGPGGLADAHGGFACDGRIQRGGQHGLVAQDSGTCDGNFRPLAPSSFWRNPDWLLCRDDRWRPVESGTFPLADGAPARVGRLRGYGNALVAEQAKIFIQAAMTP